MLEKQDNPQYDVALMFPSNYLKAADFGGEPVTLTISAVLRDKLRMVNGSKVEKYLVKFKETPKLLVLNRTNARAISSVLKEPKAINWPGEKITLKRSSCEAFGELMDCIRVEMREAS